MKLMKFMFATAAALMFTSAYAFHSGGVAECEGCHSMHSPAAGGSFLLVGKDQSSACLTCHENPGDTQPTGYHISTTDADMAANNNLPVERTPGGDFAWLKKSYSYTNADDPTVIDTEGGQTHGHNIVAVDNGYAADPDFTTAPGGTFPAAQLACNSCHDPHGKYRRNQAGVISTTGLPIWASGSYPGAKNEPTATEAVGVYRLLAGSGYSKAAFPGVPAAKVPSTYNRTEAVTQTRVAYGSGATNGHATWGNWCGTCHGAMHSSGNYVHPIDQALGSTIATNYQTYKKSGDMTGTSATSFTSLVPFIQGTADYVVLGNNAKNDNTVLTGPGTSDQVACLSCHRAHASGFPEMLRFDYSYEFMTKGGIYVGLDNPNMGTSSRVGTQTRGRNVADKQAAYYDRPATQFATYQRVLCNKCHAKD